MLKQLIIRTDRLVLTGVNGSIVLDEGADDVSLKIRTLRLATSFVILCVLLWAQTEFAHLLYARI